MIDMFVCFTCCYVLGVFVWSEGTIRCRRLETAAVLPGNAAHVTSWHDPRPVEAKRSACGVVAAPSNTTNERGNGFAAQIRTRPDQSVHGIIRIDRAAAQWSSIVPTTNHQCCREQQ